MPWPRTRNVLWFAVAVVGLAAAGVVGLRPARAPATPTPSALRTNAQVDPGTSLGEQTAPDFTLTDQFGRRVALSSLRGRVVLLAFIDSECTTICPLTSTEMELAQRMLGPAGRRVALVAVDANPTATSVADAMAYSRAHGLTHKWLFLTGSRAQLNSVWRRYGVLVQIVHGLIDHTPALYLIDAQGRERRIYMSQMAYDAIGQQAQVLARDASTLLASHPPVHSSLSYTTISGISPAQTVALPRVGGGTVTLRAGDAHVVVFFATWSAETSNLRAELRTLGRYAKAAKTQGLPGPVLVDELPTEVSPAWVKAYVRRLGAPLGYPVVFDSAGRLAEGYDVQDLPWVAVVSRARRIVAHDDGWRSARVLASQVKAALARGARAHS